MKSKSCKLMLVKYLRDGHRKTQRRVRRNILEKRKSEKSNVSEGRLITLSDVAERSRKMINIFVGFLYSGHRTCVL